MEQLECSGLEQNLRPEWRARARRWDKMEDTGEPEEGLKPDSHWALGGSVGGRADLGGQGVGASLEASGDEILNQGVSRKEREYLRSWLSWWRR